MTPQLSWIPQRELGVYSRRSGDHKVIETYNDAYALNEVAAFSWSRIGTGDTLADIATAIAARYQVTDAQAREDLLAFVDKLCSLGFVEPPAPTTTASSADVASGPRTLTRELAPNAAAAFACKVPAGHPDANVLVIVTDDRPAPDGELTVEPSVTGPVVSTEAPDPDGQPCTIEFWQPAQVESLLARFAGQIPSQEDRQPESADEAMLRRLVTGTAVVGAERVLDYRRRLMAGGYALWFAENHKYLAENNLEDVAGMIIGGDFESAAMSVYSAFNFALDARLAMDWDLSPIREEFAARVAASTMSPSERDEIMAVLLWRNYPQDPEAWVRAAARTAERMLIAVEQGWFG